MKFYQLVVVVVVMVVVELVEVSKICQPLQIWLNPKNQNWLNPKSQIYLMQKPISERIFLLSRPKKPLYIYKKLLPRF